MVTQKVIKKVKGFAYFQAEKYQAPSLFHLDYANEKGQWLAEELGADKKVVLLGTLLMDCMLGVSNKGGEIV